mgnify:CR=1 FL=1
MRKQTHRRLAALALSAALLGAALPLSAQAATFRDVPAGAWYADAVYDRATFVRRSLSSSYALRPEDARYADFVAALGALFDAWAEDGRVCVRTRAVCYLGAPAEPKGEENA